VRHNILRLLDQYSCNCVRKIYLQSVLIVLIIGARLT